MRALEDLKVGQSERYMVEVFNSLPDRAKEIMFGAIKVLSLRDIEALGMYWSTYMGDYLECESPIEKILYVAMDFVFLLRTNEINGIISEFYPQYEIEVKGKTYRVDFYLQVDCINSHKIVIECDGHEFHQKNKQQVKHDNEREMGLKILGYEVLRFSGTQIYENPMKCANDIVDYIIQKLSEERG